MNKDRVTEERESLQTTRAVCALALKGPWSCATGGGNARSKRIKVHAHVSRAFGSDGLVLNLFLSFVLLGSWNWKPRRRPIRDSLDRFAAAIL